MLIKLYRNKPHDAERQSMQMAYYDEASTINTGTRNKTLQKLPFIYPENFLKLFSLTRWRN